MRYTRRQFLCKGSAAAAGAYGMALTACERGPAVDSGLLLARENTLPQGLVAATGSDPRAIVRAALDEFGGLGQLIQPDDTVLVKPNIGFDRTPAQAANTNPDVVSEVVRLAIEAGAGEVIVLDHTLHDVRIAYEHSGIAAAAEDAGARVVHVRGKTDPRFRTVEFPEGKVTKSWPVYKVVWDADVLINVPIVKHHNLAKATMGLKNMMGLAGGNRGEWHTDLADRLCDMNQRVRVDLVVLDAFRVMVRHGPTGGSLNDVEDRRTVAVSADQVAIDAYGAGLLDMEPAEVPAVAEAARRGMGQIDLAKVDIHEITV